MGLPTPSRFAPERWWLCLDMVGTANLGSRAHRFLFYSARGQGPQPTLGGGRAPDQGTGNSPGHLTGSRSKPQHSPPFDLGIIFFNSTSLESPQINAQKPINLMRLATPPSPLTTMHLSASKHNHQHSWGEVVFN